MDQRNRNWISNATAALARLLRRDRLQDEHRIRHLAGEIIDVARSIESDVRQLARTNELADIAAHARECRHRAQEATSRWRRRNRAKVADQLHQDHWHVVTMRSELDAIMSGRRRERGTTTRSCKFAMGSRPVRSRWSTLISLTRPASLD